MEIKKVSLIDLIEVLFLLKECVRDMNEKGLKQWNNSYPGPDLIKKDIENECLFIYRERGVAKGMITLTEEPQEEYQDISWSSNEDSVLYLTRFAVHPNWVDDDIGGKLIEFVEIYAKENNYSSIRLDALESYQMTDKLFERMNYSNAGSFHSQFQKLPYTCYEKDLS